MFIRLDNIYVDMIGKQENVEAFDIEGTDDLVLSVIKDQASDIEHGWREGISNAIDSPNSSEAHLWYNESRSIISDDGSGVEITEEKGRKYLTNMGETSKKRDSSEAIGQFGIGKGQYIAKGRVSIISRGKCLHFDIKEWGIKEGVFLTDVEDAVDFTRGYNSDWSKHLEEGIEKHNNSGLTVVISHYEDETPKYSWKWADYEDDLKKRFKFTSKVTGVDVYLNEECISNNIVNDSVLPSTSVVKRIKTEDGNNFIIGIGHKADGDIDIYSNGVFVKEMQRSGFEGYIISNKNFDLNFARNEIKSGCTLWKQVSDVVDQICLEVCSKIQGEELNESAREFLVKQMNNKKEIYERFKDKNILKTASEDYFSIETIRNKDEIGISKTGNKAADKLSEAYNKIILAENDKAVKQIKKDMNLETYDVEDKAHNLGLFNKPEVLSEVELEPLQKTKLGVAKYMANRMSINREIIYGKSSMSKAWTDGTSYIAITDTSTPSKKWKQWVPELYNILIHEWCHDKSTKEKSPSHGRRFNKKFRDKIENNQKILSETIEKIDKKGVRHYRKLL